MYRVYNISSPEPSSRFACLQTKVRVEKGELRPIASVYLGTVRGRGCLGGSCLANSYKCPGRCNSESSLNKPEKKRKKKLEESREWSQVENVCMDLERTGL